MNIKIVVSIIAIALVLAATLFPIKPPAPIEKRYAVISIDGCEYISPIYESRASLIHKANCSNPIHKQKCK